MSQTEHIKDIFIEALSDQFPGLTKEQIDVTEITFETDEMSRLNALEAMLHTGCNIEPGVKTIVTLGIDGLDHDTIRAIKEALDDTTGNWSAYSSDRIEYCNTATDLVRSANPQTLKRRINMRRP